MIAPLVWITAHPETFALIAGAVVSLTSSIAKYVITPDFEEAHPSITKAIRVVAKLTSDVVGAIVEAKKKPVPPSNPTMIIMPEEPKS